MGSGNPLPTPQKNALLLIFLGFLLNEGVYTPSARKKLLFFSSYPHQTIFRILATEQLSYFL
ncbi:MAG: hypothetical protein FWH41_09245, partial [Treponema sp.]|nr:hypothetical protein [Treponema sp.]